jgi:hypothetical protein
MSRTTSLLVMGLVCCLIEPGLRSAAHAPALRKAIPPAWRFAAGPALGGRLAREIVGDQRPLGAVSSLWFLGNRMLVATWVTRSQQPRLLHPGQAGGAYRLRAFFLDARTGRLVGRGAWPVNSPTAAIVWAGRTRFVTASGGALVLRRFGQDRPSASANLPVRWQPLPAPSQRSRRELLMRVAYGRHFDYRGSEWFLVNTKTLRWVQWKSAVYWEGLGPEQIAGISSGLAGPGPTFLVLGQPGGSWRRVLRLSDRCIQPQFVGSDLVMMSACVAHRMTLVRLNDPEKALELPHGNGCTLGGGSRLVAAHGRRIALPVCQLKGSHPLLDVDGRELLAGIDVYDAPFRHRSFALRTLGPALFSPHAFALAPDGSRFAVVSGTSVEVFRLPSQPPSELPGRPSASPQKIRPPATQSGPIR